jgi:hypothetical protein
MGYRSEVVLAVSKEVLPQFLVTMAKSPETRSMCYQHADRRVDDYEEDGCVLFHWFSVKWYEGYEEVEAIQDFMDWCDDDDSEEGYRFIRLGEGLEDPAEIRGHGFEALHVQRSVTY